MNVLVRPTLLNPSEYVWVNHDTDVADDVDCRLICKVGEHHFDIVYLVCMDEDNGGFRVREWTDTWETILDNIPSMREALHYTETYELTVGARRTEYGILDSFHERLMIDGDQQMFL